MHNSETGDVENKQQQDDSGDEESEEDESEILEESPDGRWQKRREQVKQRDVPGIDCAYLAMDTEEGFEVVWNEVQFSERKSFKAQEDKIKTVFDNLIHLEHANIVKFHKYWTDLKSENSRVIFITELMSSGSMKQFLKKTKKNHKSLNVKAWKRWCTQILSALSYLHSCEPPIIHGNLNCDTIFIQHNGLIKIGSVAPDMIHTHVKTYREEQKNMHCRAPEYGEQGAQITTAVDMYAFGVCATEMAALGFVGNGESNVVHQKMIYDTIETLDDPGQKNFLRLCLEPNPSERPTARQLLFHHVLFEVHSLKLLAAHSFVNSENILPEGMLDRALTSERPGDRAKTGNGNDRILAQIGVGAVFRVQWKKSQVQKLDLEKFLEDVKNGVYPLTAIKLQTYHPLTKSRPPTPEAPESVKSDTPDPVEPENRCIVSMQCIIFNIDDTDSKQMTLTLKLDDKMNRQLSCEISPEEKPTTLTNELVHYGFINELDRERVCELITAHLQETDQSSSSSSVSGNVAVTPVVPVSA